MTGENRKQNLALEIERGQASLRAAQTLLNQQLWDDAVSRAFYAAFHHIRAMLLTEGLQPTSHRGVHHLLNLHFVRSGIVSRHLAKLFAGLQGFREQADYAQAFRFDEQDARDEVNHAQEICDFVTSWLKQNNWL